MHVRRMDPQPRARDAKVFCAGAAVRVSYWIGGVLHPAPTDMPNAYPWKDRDGEWYWRTAPRVAP